MLHVFLRVDLYTHHCVVDVSDVVPLFWMYCVKPSKKRMIHHLSPALNEKVLLNISSGFDS